MTSSRVMKMFTSITLARIEKAVCEVSLCLSCHATSTNLQRELPASFISSVISSIRPNFQIDLSWSKCICFEASRERNTMCQASGCLALSWPLNVCLLLSVPFAARYPPGHAVPSCSSTPPGCPGPSSLPPPRTLPATRRPPNYSTTSSPLYTRPQSTSRTPAA